MTPPLCLLLWPDSISHGAAQEWADEGIIRVVFVTSPGKFIATIQGERPSDVAGLMWSACASYAFCHNRLVSCGLNNAPNATDIRRTSRAEFITMKGMDESEAMKYLCASLNTRSRKAPPRCGACKATVTSCVLFSR